MNIALIGYGKMGHMIETICKERGHNIVCIIDVDNQQDFDSPEFASADVAIEFTSPTAAYANYLRAFKAGVKVVSGSTGWMKDHANDVPADELPIESIRRDEVPGIHSIVYDSDADCINITHDAHSRKGFALGAVLAAEYTKDHEGLLTTSDLFKF